MDLVYLLPAFMFLALAALFFSGFPVAWVLGGVGIGFGFVGMYYDVFEFIYFFNVISRIWGTAAENLILVAVPMFIFMGTMLERSGVANDLLHCLQVLLRRTPGGLALSVTIMGTIMAATTGIIGASVVMMTLLALPVMMERGYHVPLATGTIAASGTLGILIPPSIMLVGMGPVLEVPVTDLFAAAIIPGLMMATLYAFYALGRCWLNPSLGPALPVEDRAGNMAYVWKEFLLGLVPPAALVFSALGSIMFGLATPTEGAACGAAGALLLTLAYRRLTFLKLREALIKTLEISALILILVAASNFFGAVFSRLGTPTMLTEVLFGLDLPPMAILILIMTLIFLLGWP